MKPSFLKEELERKYHYKLRHLTSSTYPNIPAIEITNFCNLACVFCPYPKMTRPKEHMTFDVFRKIIDEIKTYPQDLTWLHIFGEPLLHPQLFDFIKYAKDANLKIGISTNAMLLNSEIGNKILNSGLDKIILCLDGWTKDTYEKIRINADFNIVKENIGSFISKARGMLGRPKIILQFIENDINFLEVNSFKKEWKDSLDSRIDKLSIIKSNDWAGHVDSKFSSKKTRKRCPCEFLWHNLVVHSDGNISVCCIDYDKIISLGNVKDMTLMEAWNGLKLKELREEHVNGFYNNGLCDNCKDWRGS